MADLLSRWTAYYEALPQLDAIVIPRWIGTGHDTLQCELHGFSDASNAAYAAALYVKVSSCVNDTKVILLMAKSRVAPLKQISIPRLELSAAVLLTRLISFVRDTLSLSDIPCHCWTDSTVALAWIRQHPSRWKSFVASRVSEIQAQLPTGQWHYVPTHENPADCASRGLAAAQLLLHEAWWQGPPWLKLSNDQWPTNIPSSPFEASLEAKSSGYLNAYHLHDQPDWDLASRFSSWPKLLRVTAYILRFVRAVRAQGHTQSRKINQESCDDF